MIVDEQGNQATTSLLSPILLELLVCPIDKQNLTLGESTLRCVACGRRYPIDDGIPNMLVDDAG